MPKFSLMYATFPGNNSEHPASSRWLMRTVAKMLKDENISHEPNGLVEFTKSDTPITMVRNLAVKEALALGVDYLMMLDSDMEPDAYVGQDASAKPFWESSWEWMLAHRDTPHAICAPYVGPPPWENIYCFFWRCRETPAHDAIKPDWLLEQYGREEAAKLGGIQEIGAAPTGLILYDMRIFRTMAPKKDQGWFYYEWEDHTCSKKASTEDVAQTRDASLAWHMSAGQAGGRIYCNWDAWAAHIKLKHCGKPKVPRIETVGSNLRDIVTKGLHTGDKLCYVGEKPAMAFDPGSKEGDRSAVWEQTIRNTMKQPIHFDGKVVLE